MVRSISFVLGCLVAGSALAAEEPRLEPGLYVEIPFGGAPETAADARLAARLDYRVGAGGSFAAPPVMQWRLDGRRNAVELLGLPLVEGLGYRLDADGDAANGKVAKTVGLGVGGTLLIGGVVAWAASEALESFGEAFGEGMGEAVVEGMAPPDGDESSGDGEAPACAGVQVGEECIGGA